MKCLRITGGHWPPLQVFHAWNACVLLAATGRPYRSFMRGMPACCWRPMAAPTGLSCVECLRIAVGRWPPLRIFRKLKADKQCLSLQQFRRDKHRLSGLRSKRLPARAIQFYDRWKSLWECCGNAVENRFAFGKGRQSLPSFLIKPDTMKCVFWCACVICSCEMLPV